MSNSSNYIQSSLKLSEKPPDTHNETPTLMPSENNEIFLKFLKKFVIGFYNKIINTDSLSNFEDSSIKWIKNTLEHTGINAEIFLELIQNHKIWSSSLVGFFYQHGIGCKVNKDKALEMYLLTI